MKLINIQVLKNNYIWIIYNIYKQCVIIDPGESEKTLQILKKLNLHLTAIFLTHHHNDHINGVNALRKYFQIPIYGSQETKKHGSNNIVKNGDNINILNTNFKVLSLPGHTLGHIGFYSAPWLFCGDTIFSAGCGKILPGKEKTMYQSLSKIKTLPKNTLICSGHEYTQSNIEFAISIMPHDEHLILYQKYIRHLLLNNKLLKPSTLKIELKINLFLRCHEISLQKKLGFQPVLKETIQEWLVFSKLRQHKDNV